MTNQTLFEFFEPIKHISNKEIIDRLGGIKDVRRKAITMDQIADFLNFEAHILSNQNNINVFYVMGVYDELYEVNVNSYEDGSWKIDALNLGERNYFSQIIKVFYNLD